MTSKDYLQRQVSVQINTRYDLLIKLFNDIVTYGGRDFRLDSADNTDFITKTKNVLRGLKGVENVYTQHTPRLVTVISDLIKGKLAEANFPFFERTTRDKFHLLTQASGYYSFSSRRCDIRRGSGNIQI
jgi:hypothetical protein